MGKNSEHFFFLQGKNFICIVLRVKISNQLDLTVSTIMSSLSLIYVCFLFFCIQFNHKNTVIKEKHNDFKIFCFEKNLFSTNIKRETAVPIINKNLSSLAQKSITIPSVMRMQLHFIYTQKTRQKSFKNPSLI